MALEIGFFTHGVTPLSEDNLNYCLLCWGATGDQPSAGNKGRLFYDTTTKCLYVDNGSSWDLLLTLDHGGLEGLGDDDHTQYQKESEKDAANGYPGLDGSTKLAFSQCPTGTGASEVAIGDHTHATVYDDQDEDTTTTGTTESEDIPREVSSDIGDGQETTILTKSITLTRSAVAQAYFGGACKGVGGISMKVRLYIDSVQQAESANLSTTQFDLITLKGYKDCSSGSRTAEFKAYNDSAGAGCTVRACGGLFVCCSKV